MKRMSDEEFARMGREDPRYYEGAVGMVSLYAEARRTRASEKRLALVIRNLAPPSRAPDCWRYHSHDVENYGHQPNCIAARAALSEVEG